MNETLKLCKKCCIETLHIEDICQLCEKELKRKKALLAIDTLLMIYNR